MLINFTVENFRSFKEPATFSMLATKDIEHEESLIVSETIGDERLLSSAVIYGPNAAGKSNLLIALALLRNLVLLSHAHQKGIKLNHQPFAFDEKCLDQPTRFDIIFISNGIRHRYHLSFDSEKIMEEALFHYPKGRKAMIFSRKGQDFEFTKDSVEQQVIARRTSENTLYLSSSVQFNYHGTVPAFDWFNKSLIVLEMTGIEGLTNIMIEKMNDDRRFKERVISALKTVDTGVVDVMGKNRTITLDEARKRYPPQIVGMLSFAGGEVYERSVQLFHEVSDEGQGSRIQALNLEQESEGTRKLFAILGPMIESLEEGKSLVVDELDTKLHHSITNWMISLFHDPTQNKKGAQLIFNTHDQLLLDLDLFRRDQIWFVERDPNRQSSRLFSLVEFRVRKDKDVLRAYGSGRYGAIPFVSASKVVR